MTFFKENSNVLIILDSDISNDDIVDFISAIQKRLNHAEQLSIVSTKELKKCINSSIYDIIICIFKLSYTNIKIFLEESLRMLKPEGILIIYESCQQQENVYSIFDERVSSLKVSGFKVKAQESLDTKQLKNLLLNIYNNIDNIFEIIAEKPSFEIGSSVTLNFGEKKSSNIWKLDSAVDEELINEDDLLDESDIVKPIINSLRVCSTTGKRKACKDCTCGLAEELSGKTAKEGTVKSSCGNCYLGDAFRCASCPYLGMPAFKPGEKVVLPESQLKAD
ncbi:anamorsin [Apis mellifera caucasica]|uniref:Anamorsin homolog n=1 Tax=Apis mellifera TaxID=7460 RepID=A0A7M7IMP7_APIME|nr:anamorsin homolog [Apis mellifera]XP_624763.2 anamorsin homolog [Apis mellifera]KAG6801454.1 anamorsin [Apis mellifera caucasica]KAG9431112.1 anamorsin [Apis mellifera carnica]|eukprot:XP_016769531.2 anamorsin homolog [Apis mellifera]